MTRTPRTTLALITANGISATALGQFQFVLPWMLLTRGFSPRDAALATACVYVPLLATLLPAGAVADHLHPLPVLRAAVGVTLAVSLLYPLGVLAGQDRFWLIFVAAACCAACRNFGEGALFRGMADTTSGALLLRAHAVRTTVNQVAIFGSPFAGLLLFHAGGAGAVMTGVCALQVAALLILVRIPRFEIRRNSDLSHFGRYAEGFASLRANPRLQAIGWVNLVWNLFAGAAIALMPAVLREHAGMDELGASATFVAGAVVVALLTIPLAGHAQRRFGVVAAFVVSVVVQGAAVASFVDANVAVLAPLLYPIFLLANSAAAASLNGARALEVEHGHQGLLSLALILPGLIGFMVGVAAAAGLVDAFGFGVVLALIAGGMAAVALVSRRPLDAGAAAVLR